MNIQFISDNSGRKTAIQLPIEEWELIKKRYPDVENLVADIPDWQKDILDHRLSLIEQNPNSIRPINELFDEL